MHTSWACLGRNLGALGELLDSLGRLFAASWTPFKRFLDALGRLWAFLGASGLDFGESWVPPGWVLESSGTVFAMVFEDNALIPAGSPALHSHWHFITPLQRGGTCAAHGIKKNDVKKGFVSRYAFVFDFLRFLMEFGSEKPAFLNQFLQ